MKKDEKKRTTLGFEPDPEVWEMLQKAHLHLRSPGPLPVGHRDGRFKKMTEAQSQLNQCFLEYVQLRTARIRKETDCRSRAYENERRKGPITFNRNNPPFLDSGLSGFRN